MDIKIYEQDDATTFLIELEHTCAIADVSRTKGNNWYFHRLNVPLKFRGQGYGKALLLSVLEWIKTHEYQLQCDPNENAGSVFNLTDWYVRYGFIVGQRSNGFESLVYNYQV